MKKILLLAIFLHSFTHSANAMTIDQGIDLNEDEVVRSLSKMLDQRIIDRLKKEHRLEAFSQAWIKSAGPSVQKLTADKNLNAQRQILMRFVEKVLDTTKNEYFTDEIFDKISQQMLKESSPLSMLYLSEIGLEVRIDNIWHKEQLFKLIDAQPAKLELYQEIHSKLKNKELIVQDLKRQFKYLGKFRHFQGKFREVNFLYKKSTQEIIAIEKEIAAEPDSIEFCIAEILRNDFFITNIRLEYKKDLGTTNPLYMPTYRFKDHFVEDFEEIKHALLSDLKKYMSQDRAMYSNEAMEEMIKKMGRKLEHQGLIDTNQQNDDVSVNYSAFIHRFTEHLYTEEMAQRLIDIKLAPIVAKSIDPKTNRAILSIKGLVEWQYPNKNKTSLINEIANFLFSNKS